jgi:hypothetical protein
VVRQLLAALVDGIDVAPSREAFPHVPVPAIQDGAVTPTDAQNQNDDPEGSSVRMGNHHVELRRIELLTSSMPWKRSTN